MRFRATLFAVLFTVGVFAVPLAAQAASLPFFGPIVPNEQIDVNGVTTNQNVCAAGWGMLIVVVNNIIRLLITLAILFVAPLMIAWSGFLFVVNPVNAAGKEQAKGILTHTIVGIVIALAGWMIVNAIMVAIYNPDAASGTTRLSAWSSLISSDGTDLCIPLEGSLAPAVTPPPTVGVVPADEQLARRVNAFQQAASSVGLSAVYEVPNETERAKIVNAGATGQVIVVSGVAPHFSVYGSGGSGGRVSNELKNNPTCPTCVPITGVSCKSGASCTVAGSFAGLLSRIPINNPSIGTWLVTEAFPPTVSHVSACHYSGTCIDAAFR